MLQNNSQIVTSPAINECLEAIYNSLEKKILYHYGLYINMLTVEKQEDQSM